MAGDLSPLTIEADHGTPRAAPPALVVSIAVGLGTVDMPVPSIAEWEWLNWRFPRPVHAGDTLYARWTLTQKRPPVSGAPSSIVVWRVDVHTADGALCAEGEIGAKVRRNIGSAQAKTAAGITPAASVQTRRRRRRPRANGAAVPEPPGVAAPPAAAAKPERAVGPSRRRRRRRSGGSVAQQEEHEPRAAHATERPAEPPPVTPALAPPATGGERGTIGRVLKRLRGT
ncbi:MAG TPA: hypothetical protein VNA65_01360 [Candidatus Dormibacteraeota bacterium]|nr:hypothetical protein [Candidatus Dormibacteraeota bacterium]